MAASPIPTVAEWQRYMYSIFKVNYGVSHLDVEGFFSKENYDCFFVVANPLNGLVASRPAKHRKIQGFQQDYLECAIHAEDLHQSGEIDVFEICKKFGAEYLNWIDRQTIWLFLRTHPGCISLVPGVSTDPSDFAEPVHTIDEWRQFIFDVFKENGVVFKIDTVEDCFSRINFSMFNLVPSIRVINYCPRIGHTFKDPSDVIVDFFNRVTLRSSTWFAACIPQYASSSPRMMELAGETLTKTIDEYDLESISLLF